MDIDLKDIPNASEARKLSKERYSYLQDGIFTAQINRIAADLFNAIHDGEICVNYYFHNINIGAGTVEKLQSFLKNKGYKTKVLTNPISKNITGLAITWDE